MTSLLYQTLVLIHVALGSVALLSFWTAGLSRKGSRVHRLAGRIYLPAMAALLAGAVPMVAIILPRAPVIGGFLAYLLILTATALWASWRAVRDKRDWVRYTGPVYRGLAWACLLAGLAVVWLGLFHARQMQWVIVLFGLIGIVVFVQARRFVRRPPTDPRWWLKEHLEAMLGNGIATHVAFLGIGLPRLLPMLDPQMLRTAAWILPIGVALAAGAWLSRKYLPPRPAR
ncbi:hypothetical protein [Arenimonas fontis]|uniref:DUF2306 domain-containing protein n=1 Tax=Arenimonas fontis TaxID=2608255 RepID=A0A5B2Z5C5_9GAMM|nr:hypothetical protein [Arenimonas fontis]KAA2284058.1 hypothetical protein F0415_11235 [Arenimonas fontis]